MAKLSPFLSEMPAEKKQPGRKTYDPKQIFQYLFDNSDRYGIIVYTQKELADAIRVHRETMNYIYQDFMQIGLLEKVDKKTFRILQEPDKFEWTEEVYDRLAELRKTHQTYYRRKQQQGE